MTISASASTRCWSCPWHRRRRRRRQRGCGNNCAIARRPRLLCDAWSLMGNIFLPGFSHVGTAAVALFAVVMGLRRCRCRCRCLAGTLLALFRTESAHEGGGYRPSTYLCPPPRMAAQSSLAHVDEMMIHQGLKISHLDSFLLDEHGNAGRKHGLFIKVTQPFNMIKPSLSADCARKTVPISRTSPRLFWEEEQGQILRMLASSLGASMSRPPPAKTLLRAMPWRSRAETDGIYPVRLRRFDAYPKTIQDYQVRTVGGAIVSILG